MGLAAFGGAINAGWFFAPLGAFFAWSIYMLVFVEGGESVFWRWLDDMLEETEEQLVAREAKEQAEESEKRRVEAEIDNLETIRESASLAFDSSHQKLTAFFGRALRRSLLVVYVLGTLAILIQLPFGSVFPFREGNVDYVVIFISYGVVCAFLSVIFAMINTRSHRKESDEAFANLNRLDEDLKALRKTGTTSHASQNKKSTFETIIFAIIVMSLVVWGVYQLSDGGQDSKQTHYQKNPTFQQSTTSSQSLQIKSYQPEIDTAECNRAIKHATDLKNAHRGLTTSELNDPNYRYWAKIAEKCKSQQR